MNKAFTLLELLVIMTVVVVLLALLTPAMHDAVYQAELATCGARLRGIAAGATQYAVEHQRHYPYRPGVHHTGYIYYPFAVRQKPRGLDHDDRPALRPYIPLNKMLNDPFCKPVNIDSAHEDSWIWLSYNLWFGFQYIRERTGTGNPTGVRDQEKGMIRLGDRLHWSGFSPSGGQPPERYSVIASDMVFTRDAGPPDVAAGHPDTSQTLGQYFNQDGQLGAPVAAQRGTVGGRQVWSLWYLNPTPGAPAPPHSPFDLNFAYHDGAVARLNEVLAYDDDRIDYVPIYTNGGSFPSHRMYLPRE